MILQSPDGCDNRRARRMRSLKQGKIAFFDQYCSVDCVVRDLSDTGAKLVLSAMPHSLENLVLHVPMDGFSVPVEKVWSNGNTWGVRFIGEKTASRIARAQILKDSEHAMPATLFHKKADAPAAPEPSQNNEPPRPVFGKRR